MLGESLRQFIQRQACDYVRNREHPSELWFANGATWTNEREHKEAPTADLKQLAAAMLRYVNTKLEKEIRDFEQYRQDVVACIHYGRTVGGDWAFQLAGGKERIESLQRAKASLEECTGAAVERRAREAAEQRKRDDQEQYDRQHRERREHLIKQVQEFTICNATH